MLPGLFFLTVQSHEVLDPRFFRKTVPLGPLGFEHRFVFEEVLNYENRLRTMPHSAESHIFANISAENSQPYARMLISNPRGLSIKRPKKI
jgi:hypothetical protein